MCNCVIMYMDWGQYWQVCIGEHRYILSDVFIVSYRIEIYHKGIGEGFLAMPNGFHLLLLNITSGFSAIPVAVQTTKMVMSSVPASRRQF